MKEKKLRVGIIGTGMIANAAHLPAYKNISDRVEVVAVADDRLEAASDTAKRWNVPNIYDNPQKMLDEMNLDLVSICTPNSSHTKWTIAALRAGAHVACEKPGAITYQDGVDMFNEMDKTGKHLFITQTRRFYDNTISAKRIMEEGRVGEAYFADLEFIRRRGVPKWGFFHMKEYNHGGPFCDLGVHWLDAFLYLTGNPMVKSVHGKAWTKIANTDEDIETSLTDSGALQGNVFTPRQYDYKEFDVEDMSAGVIRFENDLLLTFKFSWAVNAPKGERFLIVGNNGGLQLTPSPLRVYTNIDRMQAEITPLELMRRTYADVPFSGHWRLMEHIMDVLDGKCEYLIKKEEVLNNTSAIEAFYLSSQLDRDVKVTELAGYPAGK